jgi:hypothetical protein
MAMNSSGPISLGGATTGQSINLEIGSPATSTVSLNDTIVRTLAGVASGQIVVPTDFYGKSLSSGFFLIINSPTYPIDYNRVIDDPATKTMFVRSPTSSTPTSNLICRLDDTGNILYSTRYLTPAFSFSFRNLRLSNSNPNHLITAFSSQLNAPPVSPLANGIGGAIMYIDKTNGSIVSVGPKIFNGGFDVLDFPSGRKVRTYSTSPGNGWNIFFDSAGNSTGAFVGVNLNPSGPPSVRSNTGDNHLINPSGTSFNITSPNPPSLGAGFQYWNISDTGTVVNALRLTSASHPGESCIASNSNYRYAIVGNIGPVSSPLNLPIGLYKIDRNTNNIVDSQICPANGHGTTSYGNNRFITSNTDSSGNFSMTRPSNVTPAVNGPTTFNFINSSLVNTSAYVISSTTTTANFKPAFYMDGYLYITAQYSPNVVGILKIKEDGSTLGAGITATVGGYNITLTQNPSGLIISSPNGSFTATPVTPATPAITLSPQSAITTSTTPLTLTSSKTPV